MQDSIFSNARYDSGDAAGGFGEEEARAVLSNWKAALTLYSKFLVAKACLLSPHPRHYPQDPALLLKASHATADAHNTSRRGPAIQRRCAECSEQASGHLPASENHLAASLCSEHLSSMILISTAVTLYF